MKTEFTPSKEEIIKEMELHNNDEVGINDQWTYEDAEYHLLLSDKYYYLNRDLCYSCNHRTAIGHTCSLPGKTSCKEYIKRK